jgi:flagellar motor switch protein FliM
MPEEILSQEAIDRLLRELADGKPAPPSSAPSKEDTGQSKSSQRMLNTTRRVSPTSTSSNIITATKRESNGPRRIRNYDFRRPNRISKEHMRALRLIHEIFSRDIPRIWGPMLRAGGQVKIMSMEQTIYEEFRNHLAPRCLICTATMNPLEGEIAFHIELDPAYVIIDRLLGGPGTGLKRGREFTTLELNVLQRVISSLMNPWREAWMHVIHLEPTISRVLSNTEFLQLTAMNESVLVTTFQARFLNTDIEMTVCIPYAVIAPIMARIVTPEGSAQATGGDQVDHEHILHHMRYMPLPVTARLGAAAIPVSTLSKLEVGDVIRLGVPKDGNVVIRVGERPHFIARPGLSNGGLAVQIMNIIPERLQDDFR